MTRTGRQILALGAAVAALLTVGCSDSGAPNASSNAATTARAPAPEVARPAGPERLVLAFGDSLYAGYRVEPREALPVQVQDRLRGAGINATVVNAGVSGDTSAAGRQRLAFTLDNLARAPDLVILGLGGNDALRQIPPQETRANMTAMMEELKRRNIPVVLTGMRAPPNLGPEYARAFEPIWPELARQYGATLYPFILERVITDRALMQRDGVHPNAEGIRVMADAVAPLAREAIAKRP